MHICSFDIAMIVLLVKLLVLLVDELLGLLVVDLLVDYPTLDNPTEPPFHPLSTIPLNIVFPRNREMGDEMRYR